MTSSPLTDQQLDDIETRANAATPGPWCTVGAEIFQGAEYTPDVSPWIGETCRASGGMGKADAVFAAHARSDVPALVAEVRRLQKQRKFLIDQLAKKDAVSGDADRKLREFLAADGPEDDGQPAIRP